jgi:hypothetical protein
MCSAFLIPFIPFIPVKLSRCRIYSHRVSACPACLERVEGSLLEGPKVVKALAFNGKRCFSGKNLHKMQKKSLESNFYT